jgi:hypothetical protein
MPVAGAVIRVAGSDSLVVGRDFVAGTEPDSSSGGLSVWVWTRSTGHLVRYPTFQAGDGCEDSGGLAIEGTQAVWLCVHDTLELEERELVYEHDVATPARVVEAKTVSIGITRPELTLAASDGLIVTLRNGVLDRLLLDESVRLERIGVGLHVPMSVSEGRIAAFHGDQLVVLDAAGHRLATLIPTETPLAVALSGVRVYVLGTDGALAAYNIDSGRLVRSYEIGGGGNASYGWLGGIAGGFAICAIEYGYQGLFVHVIRLADGAELRIPATGLRNATITSAGLAYESRDSVRLLSLAELGRMFH